MAARVNEATRPHRRTCTWRLVITAATGLIWLRPASPDLGSPASLNFAQAASPRHLVVLQHGLSGTPTDLSLLGEELRRRSKGLVLPLFAKSNTGQNQDGVAAGGGRLADEVREVAAKNPGLAEISLVGNSLGGLYTRYAAAELLQEDGLLAGLKPTAFVTVGCPHLGVRRFLYLPVPGFLHGLARVLVGQTGEELMLRDPKSILMTMSQEGTQFLAALRSFKVRVLYANVWGDFMVPFGTAAIEPSWGPGILDEQKAASLRDRPGIEVLSEEALNRQTNGPVFRLPATASAVDGATREVHLRTCPTEEALAVGVSSSDDYGENSESEEVVMARGLEAPGWEKFAVAFQGTGMWWPWAHNKIAALRREGWRKKAFSWLEQTGDGDELMGHMAEEILRATTA